MLRKQLFDGTQYQWVVAFVLLSLWNTSSEAMVLLDFNDVGVAPTRGGFWNTLGTASDVAAGGLLDTAGNATSLTITFSGSWSDSAVVQTGYNDGAGMDWADAASASDFFFATDTVAGLVIGGLKIGQPYMIEIVAARATSGSNTATYAVQDSYTDIDCTSYNFDAYADGWMNVDLLRWTNQYPHDVVSEGQIELALDAPAGQSAFLAALIIKEVPEPDSLGLLVLSAIGLLRRGFKKGKWGR